MSADKIKHLEFIQNVITRMNTNSFLIKGWCIVIISAFFAIYASTKDNNFFLVAIVPTLLFWFLDAYYLNQERRFRGIYNDVAGISTGDTNEKKEEIKPFQMPVNRYTKGSYSYWNTFFSITIVSLYLTIIASLVFIFIYLQT